jgi:hypothetical protein
VRPKRRGGGQGRGSGGQSPGRGGQGRGRPAPRNRAAQKDDVPNTDEVATSAEGLESGQSAVEPQVETTPAPVADAPDTVTPNEEKADA